MARVNEAEPGRHPQRRDHGVNYSVEARRGGSERLIRWVRRREVLDLVAAFVPVYAELGGRIPIRLPNSSSFVAPKFLQCQSRGNIIRKPHLVHASRNREPLRAVGDGFGLKLEQARGAGEGTPCSPTHSVVAPDSARSTIA